MSIPPFAFPSADFRFDVTNPIRVNTVHTPVLFEIVQDPYLTLIDRCDWKFPKRSIGLASQCQKYIAVRPAKTTAHQFNRMVVDMLARGFKARYGKQATAVWDHTGSLGNLSFTWLNSDFPSEDDMWASILIAKIAFLFRIDGSIRYVIDMRTFDDLGPDEKRRAEAKLARR